MTTENVLNRIFVSTAHYVLFSLRKIRFAFCCRHCVVAPLLWLRPTVVYHRKLDFSQNSIFYFLYLTANKITSDALKTLSRRSSRQMLYTRRDFFFRRPRSVFRPVKLTSPVVSPCVKYKRRNPHNSWAEGAPCSDFSRKRVVATCYTLLPGIYYVREQNDVTS